MGILPESANPTPHTLNQWGGKTEQKQKMQRHVTCK